MFRFALATALATAEGAELAVTWSDCGAKHGVVQDLKPTVIHTGATETLVGSGTSDEDVTSAQFTATLSALGTKLTECSGDATTDIVCQLPMGVGSITVKAVTFPMPKGATSIPVEVTTSSIIPPSLASVDVHIAAVDQNGESAICLDVHTNAKTLSSAHPSFEEWAAQYGFNGADDTMRAKYNANLAEIDRLNAADTGATFAVNQFSGMTFEEFEAAYLTEADSDTHNVDSTKVSVTYLEEHADLADSIDWVAKGGVTPVKDQGQCGSCWAFSTMAVVEAVHKINSGKTVKLAEQQLVDCNTNGQSGCGSGSATTALKWLKSNPACTTNSYPYKASQGPVCKSCDSAGVTVGGVNMVTSRSESALASALKHSPASVSVNAGKDWQHYSSGILQSSTACSHNHAVLAVGYTGDAWKIKNSWGKSWGESGYIRIAKGLGGCGASGIVTSSARIPTGVNVESVAV